MRTASTRPLLEGLVEVSEDKTDSVGSHVRRTDSRCAGRAHETPPFRPIVRAPAGATAEDARAATSRRGAVRQTWVTPESRALAMTTAAGASTRRSVDREASPKALFTALESASPPTTRPRAR